VQILLHGLLQVNPFQQAAPGLAHVKNGTSATAGTSASCVILPQTMYPRPATTTTSRARRCTRTMTTSRCPRSGSGVAARSGSPSASWRGRRQVKNGGLITSITVSHTYRHIHTCMSNRSFCTISHFIMTTKVWFHSWCCFF
jgi:hypothetical protein